MFRKPYDTATTPRCSFPPNPRLGTRISTDTNELHGGARTRRIKAHGLNRIVRVCDYANVANPRDREWSILAHASGRNKRQDIESNPVLLKYPNSHRHKNRNTHTFNQDKLNSSKPTQHSAAIMFFRRNSSMPKPETAQEVYEQILYQSHNKIFTIPYFTTKQNETCSNSLGPTSLLLKLSRSLTSKRARKARHLKFLAQVEYLEAWYNEAPSYGSTTTFMEASHTFDVNNNTKNPNDDMIVAQNTETMYIPWDAEQVLSYYQPSMSHQLPPTMKTGGRQQQQQFSPCSNMGIMI